MMEVVEEVKRLHLDRVLKVGTLGSGAAAAKMAPCGCRETHAWGQNG
jgi:hypothetical protein